MSNHISFLVLQIFIYYFIVCTSFFFFFFPKAGRGFKSRLNPRSCATKEKEKKKTNWYDTNQRKTKSNI